MGIVVEEAEETVFWLEVLSELESSEPKELRIYTKKPMNLWQSLVHLYVLLSAIGNDLVAR
jgi:hypothetical protein